MERPSRTVGKAPFATRRSTVRVDMPPSWLAVSFRLQRSRSSGGGGPASLSMSDGFFWMVTRTSCVEAPRFS